MDEDLKIQALEDRLKRLEEGLQQHKWLSANNVISAIAVILSLAAIIIGVQRSQFETTSEHLRRFQEILVESRSLKTRLTIESKNATSPEQAALANMQWTTQSRLLASEALSLIQQIDDKLEFEERFGFADLLLSTSHPENAYEQLEILLKSNLTSYERGRVLQGFSLLSFKKGKYFNPDLARDYMRNALEELEKSMDPESHINSALYLEKWASEELRIGEKQRAIELYKMSEKAYESSSAFSDIANKRLIAVRDKLKSLDTK